VYEGEGASKKQAMHGAAAQALQVVGQCAGNGETKTVGSTSGPATPASKVLAGVASGKNPVMIVNEVYPEAEFSLVSETGESMAKTFVMALLVEGRTFRGSGRSKRLAKAHAAQMALSELHGVTCCASPGESSPRVLYVLWKLKQVNNNRSVCAHGHACRCVRDTAVVRACNVCYC